MGMISLRCKACDGLLEVDENNRIFYCPYCGSKELVEESDEVKKERIRSDAQTKIELGKMDTEIKKQQESRKTLLYWIIGFIGALLAYVLINKLIWL